MFHRAKSLKFKRGTTIELTYMNGEKRRYDMGKMIDKFPFMWDLKNRKFFKSGELDPGGYGVIWSDDIDISCEEVYVEGDKV